MTFSEVFGGALLFPSQLSYSSITTAVSITLQWPTEQQVGGTNVVSDFLDINTTAVSLNIDMPSASATGTGNKATINNIGANTFTVRDSAGATIQSVAPGEVWVIVLTDNTTAAGTWTTFQLGATVSVASASALAGAGIKAISATLNQMIESNVEGVTPFTVVDADRAKCLIYTAGVGVCNLPTPGTVGADWFFALRNSGTGDLVATPPAGQIDGASTRTFAPGESAFIFTDGTDFFTVGFGQSSASNFDFVSIAVPGSGDFTLTGSNLDRISYRFTGILTGNRKIVVPNTTQEYWVDNQTTGAFDLSIGTAAQGVPPVVPQGDSAILYSNATDVVNATSSSITFPITISQGGTGAITAASARTNLGAAADTLTLTAGVGITGGGDLTANRTFTLDLDELATSVADTDGDFFAVVDAGGVNRKITKANVALSGFNNDSGFTANVGTVTQVDGGLGLIGSVTASGALDIVNAANGGIQVNANDIQLDIDNLSVATPIAADELAFDDAGVSRKVTFTDAGTLFETIIDHDNLVGFVADEHVAHGSVNLTAGNGLTGGGTIAASRTFDVGAGSGINVDASNVIYDISGLTEMTLAPLGTDDFFYLDGTINKKINWNQFRFPRASDGNDHPFADVDISKVVQYTGAGGHDFTMNSGIGDDDSIIVVVNRGTGNLTFVSGTATLETAAPGLVLPPSGMAVLLRESSTIWQVGGTGLIA